MDQNFTGVVLWLSYFWTVFNGMYIQDYQGYYKCIYFLNIQIFICLKNGNSWNLNSEYMINISIKYITCLLALSICIRNMQITLISVKMSFKTLYWNCMDQKSESGQHFKIVFSPKSLIFLTENFDGMFLEWCSIKCLFLLFDVN